MQIPDWKIEEKLWQDGWNLIIGIDEAGRGPLAGPVVACALALRKQENPQLRTTGLIETSESSQLIEENDKNWDLVRDSKKLSAQQRERIFDFIQDNFYVGVGICNHQTIDRINILQSSFLAMKEAITSLEKNIPLIKKKSQDNFRNIILVDGNKKIPNLSREQEAIISGDKIVKSISAASIIAKVTRDRIMLKAHKKYPQYRFDKHKGYGTKIHMEALSQFGPCEIHRQSFKPVKRCLK